MPKTKYIFFPILGKTNLEIVIGEVIELRRYHWTLKKWTFRPALIDRSSGTTQEFIGQKFDPKKFDLVHDGWTHDHCEICSNHLSEGDENEEFETEGFNYTNRWICKKCYNAFIKPKDIGKVISNLEIIEK